MTAQGLTLRQEAAKRAHDRMLATLIEFSPAGKLTVDDVRFIAEWCRTVTFEALTDVAAKEQS